ncbi:MAG: hypothetical protein ACP5PA_07370 [Elusimicrobiales bacterium]
MKILQLIGLILGFIGSLLLLFYPPVSKIPPISKNGKFVVYSFCAPTKDPDEAKREVQKAYKLSKLGFLCLALSFFL